MTSLEENETLRVDGGDDEAEADLDDIGGDGGDGGVGVGVGVGGGDIKFLFVGFIIKKLKNLKNNVNAAKEKDFCKTSC